MIRLERCAVFISSLATTLFTFSAMATVAVGVASFEDGTSTYPVGVWYAPGSVTNVAGGHEGLRAVAATGNVRVSLDPTSDQTRLAYWMKTSVQTHISGYVQYYDGAWLSLGQDNLDLAADLVWREQVIRLNKPAGTVHVFATMWLPGGVTATFDDVTGAADNPPGAVDGFETGSSGSWSVWYSPGSVQNTNVTSHAGTRSVAVSGPVKFGVAPMVNQATFWHRRASGSAAMGWQVQYFDKNWVMLTQSTVGNITSSTTWQQSTIPIAEPANTRYVLIGVWPNGSGDGATVNIDDFSTVATVQPALRPLANLSSWNTLVSDLPYTLIAHPELHASHWWVNLESYSIPVVNSLATDPQVAVTMPANYGRPAGVVNVRIPSGVTGAAGGDEHLQVNDTGGVSHSFYGFVRTSDTAATATAYGSTPLDGDGFLDPATGLNAGTRAPQASPMAGLLSAPELAAGEIEHALAVGVPGSMLLRGWVPPARSEDGNAPTNYTGSIPMGSRLVIPPTATMPSGLSPLGQKLWRCAQSYGWLIVDQVGGTSPVIYADPRSMTSAQVDPLRVYWCPTNCSGSDLDLIVAQLQVARN